VDPTAIPAVELQTDNRRKPRSPEHRAAIQIGLARSRWSGIQSKLAKEGEVHDLVPVKGDKPIHMRRGVARPGIDCHWCVFWGTNAGHTGGTFEGWREPVKVSAVTGQGLKPVMRLRNIVVNEQQAEDLLNALIEAGEDLAYRVDHSDDYTDSDDIAAIRAKLARWRDLEAIVAKTLDSLKGVAS
jgi:hypothetical protein